jgi:DNA invertase Pin-like site-specific DNA recombinase
MNISSWLKYTLIVTATLETLTPLVRAACYCRISSDPNDKKQGTKRQREDTAIMCEVNGWTPIDYYVDDDRSASNGKGRPAWDRVLADMQAGLIDAVVVWNQDRGWRKMADLEDLRPAFASLGVKLATTNIGIIDFNNADDVFRVQVSTALSEMEIAKMKVRMRRAARQKAEQGKPQWRNAFGYLPETRRKEDDDGTRTPDPKTAKLVAEAYRMILAGSSLGEIGRMFNDAGAHGLTDKPWTESTVSLFLRAARNAGLRSHNGVIVGQGTWVALVKESTWKAAQSKLNAPGRAPGRKSVRKHPLTGVLQCGKEGCGGYLSGHWVMQKTGGASGRPKAGQEKEPHSGQVAHSISYGCKTCRGVSVRAELIEPVLRRLVGGRLAMPDAVDLLKDKMLDEAEEISQELNDLYHELDQIGVERGRRELTGPQAKIATELINAEIAKLTRRQQDQERLRVFDGIPLGTPEAVEKVAKIAAASPDRFRAIVALLMTPTVMPVGKSGKVFDADRLKPNWHD